MIKPSHIWYGLLLIAGIAYAPFIQAASLGLSPASGTYAPDKFFSVDILLNTEGASIDGVDIRYLNYNPAELEVQDADPTRAGVQITAGSLMPLTLANKVDTAAGRIEFSQIAAGGTRYSNSSDMVLAKVDFKVKNSSGQSSLTFNYQAGKGDDNNIASSGTDILNKVSTAAFVLGSSGGGSTSSTVPPSSTTGGGAGGGGGGGGGAVSAPQSVPAPSNTAIYGASNQILIVWDNPVGNPNFVRVKVIRKVGSAPVTASDGVIVYEGDKEEFTDTSVVAGTVYYYGVFSIDTNLQASSLQRLKASLGEKTDAEVMAAQAQNAAPSPITPPSSGSGSGYVFTSYLTLGAQGEAVRQLQLILISKGYLAAGNSSSYFGDLTQSALKAFQSAHGIASSGTPGTTGYGATGPRTRLKLNELSGASSSTTPPTVPPASGTLGSVTIWLIKGLKSAQVTNLQNILISKGFLAAGNNTGFFGNLTEKALKDFQCRQNIVCEGSASSSGWGATGPRTRASLNTAAGTNMTTPAAPSSATSVQEQLLQAQAQLQQLMQLLQAAQSNP